MRRYHRAVDAFVVSQAPSDSDIAALGQRMGGYDAVVVGTINAHVQPQQAVLVKVLLEVGIPVVAVALRLPYDLQGYPGAPTYLCTYSILEPSMDALARVLWGEAGVQGRLPVSIPGMYGVGDGVVKDPAEAGRPVGGG